MVIVGYSFIEYKCFGSVCELDSIFNCAINLRFLQIFHKIKIKKTKMSAENPPVASFAEVAGASPISEVSPSWLFHIKYKLSLSPGLSYSSAL